VPPLSGDPQMQAYEMNAENLMKAMQVRACSSFMRTFAAHSNQAYSIPAGAAHGRAPRLSAKARCKVDQPAPQPRVLRPQIYSGQAREVSLPAVCAHARRRSYPPCHHPAASAPPCCFRSSSAQKTTRARQKSSSRRTSSSPGRRKRCPSCPLFARMACTHISTFPPPFTVEQRAPAGNAAARECVQVEAVAGSG
jgi:hypothetical protein